MVHGYILIETDLGIALDVTNEIANVEGVKKACSVTGPFDIIATFDVKDIADVANVVVKGIQCIDGVWSTQTAICVSCK